MEAIDITVSQVMQERRGMMASLISEVEVVALEKESIGNDRLHDMRVTRSIPDISLEEAPTVQ